MFAYVKYVSGAHAGEKRKIPVRFIKYNFKNTTDFDRAKKYQMKYNVTDDTYGHKGLIIFLKENEKELVTAITTQRQKILPNNLLISASENTSDESEEITQSATQSTTSTMQIKDNLKVKLEQFEYKITKKSDNNMDHAGIKNKSNITDAKINDEESDVTIDHGEQTNMTDMMPVLRIVRNEGIQLIKKDDKKLKALQDKIEYLQNQRTKDVEVIESLEKKLQRYKEQIKENEKSLKKLAEIKEKYEKAKEKIEELDELNKGIQRKLIESSDESRTVLRNLDNAIEVDTRLNFVPVGVARKSDDTIHIGHNKWIPKTVFDNVMNAKNPSTAVSNILINVFGEEVLMNSTLTGRKSNASNNSSSCVGEKPNKLDASMVKLCQDWYGYWLRNKYIHIAQDVNIISEYNEFTEYASRKIAYMKRDSNPNKTKRKRTLKKDKKHRKYNSDSEENAKDNNNLRKKRNTKKDANEVKDAEEENYKTICENEESATNYNDFNNYMDFSPLHESEASKEEQDPLI